MSLDNIIKKTIEEKFDCEVEIYPTKFGYKIQKINEFDITLIEHRNNLTIGVLNSYKPGNGRKVVESLKIATDGKYKIIANKTESIGFWEKIGFYQSDSHYPDYEYCK